MNAQMKQKNSDNISREERELQHINAEMARINEKYKPLCAATEEKKARRDHAVKLFNDMHVQVAGLLNTSHKTKVHTSSEESRHGSEQSILTLDQARGFNCHPGSTHSRVSSHKPRRDGGLSGSRGRSGGLSAAPATLPRARGGRQRTLGATASVSVSRTNRLVSKGTVSLPQLK
jgi:hypothetical protein